MASPDEVAALAETLNRRLAEMQDPNSKSKRGWFQAIAATPTSHHPPLTLTLTTDPNPNPNPNPHQLFNHMDGDGTGRITYSEFAGVVRKELQFSPKVLPEGGLAAVWAALDTDSTGFVGAGEFGAFMRRGEHAVSRINPSDARLAIALQLRATLEAEGTQRMREVARENAREARETEREAARLELMLRRERGHLQELTSRNASRAGSSRSSGVANPTARPVTAHQPLPPSGLGRLGGAPVPSRRVVYDGSGSPPPGDDVLELRRRLEAEAEAEAEAEGWSESMTPLHLPRTAPRTSQSARGHHQSSSSDLPMLTPYGPPTTSRPGGGGGRSPRDIPGSPVRPYQHVPHHGSLPVGPPSSARFATPRPPTSAR